MTVAIKKTWNIELNSYLTSIINYSLITNLSDGV